MTDEGKTPRCAALSDEDLNQALKKAYSEWHFHHMISPRHWPVLLKQAFGLPSGSFYADKIQVQDLRTSPGS